MSDTQPATAPHGGTEVAAFSVTQRAAARDESGDGTTMSGRQRAVPPDDRGDGTTLSDTSASAPLGDRRKARIARWWNDPAAVWRMDLLAAAGLVALLVLLDRAFLDGPLLLGMDTATAFYPWYGFLGEQLRAGHIPVWNPAQFGGTPFAGDPESGWMYLPTMVAFTLLPLEAAARTHMVFHVTFAGVTMYALARSLGASVSGALLAGLAYAQSGFLQGHTVCCLAYSSVATWLPLLLLGADRAIGASFWRTRGLWWGIAGLAFSQILAVWIGQAAYYAALLLGAFVAWRTVVAPPERGAVLGNGGHGSRRREGELAEKPRHLDATVELGGERQRVHGRLGRAAVTVGAPALATGDLLLERLMRLGRTAVTVCVHGSPPGGSGRRDGAEVHERLGSAAATGDSPALPAGGLLLARLKRIGRATLRVGVAGSRPREGTEVHWRLGCGAESAGVPEPPVGSRLRERLTNLVIHVAGISLFGCGLAAAGLLPRLEYNVLSNLPGGYPAAGSASAVAALTDWGIIDDWVRRFLQPGFSYPGVTVLALAALGLVLARRQPIVWFLALLTLVVLILARAEPTPLASAFNLLPGFERIHGRSPERLLLMFYVGPAVLAGLAVTALQRRARRPLAQALPVLLMVAVAVDLHLAWGAQLAESLAGGGDYQFAQADVSTYFAPPAGVTFLQQQAAQQAPDQFRSFGFVEHVFGGPVPYTLRWTDPRIAALDVNNRALSAGLQDIQGYNPLHIARYDDFLNALNGSGQNYHHADVQPDGLSSPLLDVLNVRYIITPTQPASDERAPAFTRPLNVVYADAQVTIRENPTALPRAWLVHRAKQVAPGTAAGVLASGAVDARQVVLLETAPPPDLGEPPDGADETVRIEAYAADRLSVRAASSMASVLILSEVYYPAWQAYVDGQPTPVLVADGALRAVALPAGEHVVEMRFESLALRVGLALSLMSALLLAGLVTGVALEQGTNRSVGHRGGARPRSP